MRMLVCLLMLALVLPCAAQLVNMPPAPQWLRNPQPGMTVERTVAHHGKLLKAILLVASNAPCEVRLNDQLVGRVEPKDAAASVDVTRFLREGNNQLSIHSEGRQIAALLELNGDLASKIWVATDATWKGAADMAVMEPQGSPFDFKKTFDAYNSWQLAKPGAQAQATPVSEIQAPEGFKVELVRSAQAEEGSWVSMAFDPRGRLTLGVEKKGLLRFDPAKGSMERIDDELLECRGLLYAHGALYANANNSHGLWRLRDTDGDDRFDERRELLHTEGGVGHGRNHLKLGPDGDIYIAHGNNVLLPTNLSDKSPLKQYRNDQLLPNPWDDSMFDGNVELPAGHILRMKPDGSEVQLIAGGLRNPLDIAFNREGELFTFDADMERDVGAPWYMPTRVLHVVPGADFGWRRGTGRYPSYYIDTLPSVIDIGLSSPTGVFFGYGAKFPERYQDALFILDWSYGRIIAVHLRSHWSSYGGNQETFISGRPLNVTDGCIGPDSAMWFITGGRGTQSGLYRVTYAGQPKQDYVRKDEPHCEDARFERRRLEQAAPGSLAPVQLLYAIRHWDPFIRWEARMYLERCPAETQTGLFRDLYLTGVVPAEKTAEHIEEILPVRDLELSALRVGSDSDKELVWARCVRSLWHNVGKLPFLEDLRDSIHESVVKGELTDALRLITLALRQEHALTDADKENLEKACAEGWRWMPAFKKRPVSINIDGTILLARPPSKESILQDQHLRWELAKLLIRLKSKHVLPLVTAYLKTASTSEDLLFYPMHLRYLKDGWTLEQRRVVFEALNRAEKLNGASSYFKAIADTRAELAAALSVEDAKALAEVIAKPQAPLLAHAMPAHSYKQWTMKDLEPLLAQAVKGRSIESARKALGAAQCVFCHRVSAGNELPAGLIGPDLTQVSARFGRKDLLMHILEPSAVIDEKFRATLITKTDGTEVSGMFEREDDERVVLKPNPLSNDVLEVGKAQIKARKLSEVSPMPPGLLNVLKAEQILDLLAWFESGGDATKPVWSAK